MTEQAQPKKNILFIMFDQLRWDYLSCAGHPTLHTPHIDRIAQMGVRFTRAYCQSPICGSSRMSTYTGRYPSSHGAQFNGFPLRVGEQTMADHLRRVGMDCWLIGKTHMVADAEGMARLGLEPDSLIGARQAECGFDVWVREDGLNAEGPEGFYDEKRSPYNEWLKQQGYPGHNPWHVHANAGVDATFNLAQLVAHAAKTRNLCAGTVIGTGTISNKGADGGPGKPVAEGGAGYSCIAEIRMIETIAGGAPVTPFMAAGDTVRIEMRDAHNHSIFGAIEQTVVAV